MESGKPQLPIPSRIRMRFQPGTVPVLVKTRTLNQRLGRVLPVLDNKYNCQAVSSSGATIAADQNKLVSGVTNLLLLSLAGSPRVVAIASVVTVTTGLSVTCSPVGSDFAASPKLYGINPLRAISETSTVQAANRLVIIGRGRLFARSLRRLRLALLLTVEFAIKQFPFKLFPLPLGSGVS